MFEAELAELGLTANESKVYLALLGHGILNPTKLAELTGLHRSYIYDTLDRLLERGIISTILVDGKRHYQAQDPKALRDGVELQLRRLDEILPQLSQLFGERTEGTRIELHKGERALRTLIKEIVADIVDDDSILFISVDENFVTSVEPVYLRQYFTVLREHNATERIIIAKGGTRLPDAHITYRELDPDAFGSTMIAIHRDKVYLFEQGRPMHLIAIASAQVAESYRKQFEWLWARATP